MASVTALDVPVVPGDRGPGMRGPALEQALGPEGLTFGPPAAELGVRHPRRLRRDPLGRAELHRRRPVRRPGRRPDPGHAVRRAGARASAGHAAGPDLLGLALGSEGTLGVHHRAAPAGAARGRRAAPTRAGRSAAGPPGSPRCSSWPGTTCCPTSSGCPTPTRPGRTCSWRRAPAPGAARHARARGARRRLPAGARLGGAARHGAGPGTRPPRRVLRDGGAIRLGRRVGESWKSHRLRRPLPAGPAAGRRPAGRDAGDGGHLDGAAHRYDAVRRALRESLTRDGTASAGHEPRLARRTRPAPRCTSRCSPTGTTTCPSSSG